MVYNVLINRMQKRKKTFFNFTLWLVGINIFVYILFLFLIYFVDNKAFYWIALQPSAFFQGEKIWTVFTSMFMHDPGSIFHIFANMASLVFLGGFLERIIGSKRFIGIYLISGIMASLTFVYLTWIFNGDLTIAAVGASGAIFGIAGLTSVLVPKMKVYIMFIPIPIPMWIAVILMLSLMWIASLLFGLSIGNFAHLGGFLTGLIYGFYLKKKFPAKIRLLGNYFSK